MCGLYNNGNKDLYVVWGSDILISGFLMKCHTNFGSFRYEEDRAVWLLTMLVKVIQRLTFWAAASMSMTFLSLLVSEIPQMKYVYVCDA